MNRRDIGKLVASLVICEGAGAIGGIFTVGSVSTWYATLEKPPLTPPNSVFGPVWIALYLLMGISIFLLWRRGAAEPKVMPAFIIFWVQLGVNVAWSLVFFGFQSIAGGVAVIAALWILILFTTILSFRVSKLAGGILLPYIAWVTNAAYLNIGIWMLNP